MGRWQGHRGKVEGSRAMVFLRRVEHVKLEPGFKRGNEVLFKRVILSCTPDGSTLDPCSALLGTETYTSPAWASTELKSSFSVKAKGGLEQGEVHL